MLVLDRRRARQCQPARRRARADARRPARGPPQSVRALLAGRGDAPYAACAYEDGRGHPLAFARSTFDDLSALHGDKGVWKLLDRHADQVVDVPTSGPIPRDVDTDADYRAVLAESEQKARA